MESCDVKNVEEIIDIENEMIDAYIGPNKEGLFKSNINWISAFLGQTIGPAWFFYKKAPLIGLGFILFTALIVYLSIKLEIFAYSIMFIIYLYSTNSLYLWSIKQKIKKILKNNPNASQEELLKLAKLKGGTNSAALIVYIVLFFILVYILVIVGIMLYAYINS